MYVYKYIYTASNTFYISLKYAILPFKKNIYCKVGILKFLDFCQDIFLLFLYKLLKFVFEEHIFCKSCKNCL